MTLEEAIKSSKFRDQRHKSVLNMLYTAYWLKSNFAAGLKEHGITIEQFNVLRILKGKYPEPMRVKDIGNRILETSSNVPRIIDRLVVKKLATREPSKEDKRETMVSITAKGLLVIGLSIELVDSMIDETTGIDNGDGMEINELLEKMRNPPMEGL